MAGAGGAAGTTDTPDPCEALDCSDHGECTVEAADAACVCAEGYVGELCDECEPGRGFSSAGECVPLCEAENAPDCGAFGHCVVTDELAVCECEHPRGGDTCQGCAEGYALEGDECKPHCSDCGPHSWCDATPLVPACACVAGYRREGELCTWVGDGETGGIVNGSLASETGWQLRNVTIANNSATFGSNGQGTSCELGLLSQTIKMPKRGDAEQLVLEIDALSSCAQVEPDACPPLLVELGTSVTRVRVPGGANPQQQTVATCLGEAGYGGEIPLRIRPGLASPEPSGAFRCGVDDWPSLHGVRIRTAEPSECPPASRIWNRELNQSAGWDLVSGASISGGALHLGSNGIATTKVEFPLPFSVPSPALRFTKTNGRVHIVVDGIEWTALGGGSASSTGAQTLCLPDFLQGAIHEVQISGNVNLTDLSFVTQASCEEGKFDLGFERPLGTGSWFSDQDPEVVSDGQAHGGDHIVRFETPNANLRSMGRFPEPAPGDGHAAFRIWRRVEAENQDATHRLIAFGPQPFAVSFNNTVWTVDIKCPGRAWDGQIAPFYLTVSPSDGSRAWLDDTGPGLSTECN